MKFAVLATAILATGCATVIHRPPPPLPEPPPNVHPPTMESCERAEAKLAELDCRRDDGTPWARTPAGAHFADACKSALADGRTWTPQCLSRMTDCSQLGAAFRGAWCGRDGDSK